MNASLGRRASAAPHCRTEQPLAPLCRRASLQPIASTSGHHAACDQQRDADLPAAHVARRQALAMLAIAPALLQAPSASAIQGMTAGRIPGVSKTADEDGYYSYTRPEGKSGGHGIGWSEVPQYSFKVPEGWQETPVSIADLGGTEIDLRFSNRDEGDLTVVVAPVLRFVDVGFNADVRIENLGNPTKIINGFAPELFGKPLEDDSEILSTRVVAKGPLTYYEWQLKPHSLVAATAYRNRVFILTVTANARQWRKHEAKLRHIQESFAVPVA